MGLEQRLNAAWYGKPGLLQGLLPLEWLYRGVSHWNRQRRQTPRDHAAVPVVVVGNITVGGSGKTPLVIALVHWLQAQGRRPGVVSRGYGGRAPSYPWVVTSSTDPAQGGDEPCLIARRTGVPVVVCPDRPAGVERLVEQGCDIVVSDDGLQHYAMARDFEIVVLDGSRGLGNGHCLPVGPLREPAQRLQTVDAVILNGEAEIDTLEGLGMSLQPGPLKALLGGHSRLARDWPADKRRIHAVAGIGNPQRFFDSLRSLGFEPIEHAFPDHYRYRQEDLAFGDHLPVIMTEKDAVKCRSFVRDNWWYLPIDALVDEQLFERLSKKLAL